MLSILNKIKKNFVIFIVILTIGISYFSYIKFFKNRNAVNYLTEKVKKGNIVVSISGTGQVSALDQIDIKSKISSQVLYINVKEGQIVSKRKLLIQLDDSDAKRAVQDAEIALESARINLEKLLKPTDELTILQAENALKSAQEAKQRADKTLEELYDKSFNVIANTFLDLPLIMSDLNDILFNKDFFNSQWNLDYYTDILKKYDPNAKEFRDNVYYKYQLAKVSYDKNFESYKSITRYSNSTQIVSLVDETYETAKKISESLKNTSNLIQLYKDKLKENDLKIDPITDSHLSLLNSYLNKVNSYLASILDIKNSLQNSLNEISNLERSIREKEEYLEKLKKGPDELDILSAKLNVKQKENELQDAKERLIDYQILAPFDGVVAKINVKKGDIISAHTPLVTLITNQKIVEVSLNEIDASKVKVGNKAILTFDALPDLKITGKVYHIDLVGTENQGVVSYGVKILLDENSEKIKPGMSVNVEIIVDSKENVLLVPNSTLKSQRNNYFVEVIQNGKPQVKEVKIGLSNDEVTEIISGLKEGDIVITGISNLNQNNNQRRSLFQFPGFGGSRMPGAQFR